MYFSKERIIILEMKTKQIISCSICNSKKIFFRDKFWVCADCGYETAGIFNSSIIEHYYNKEDLGLWVQTLLENTGNTKLRKCHKIILRYFNSHNISKLRICDIGCGTGFFLYQLKKMNFDVFGYDINQSHIDIAKNKYGLNNIFGAKTLKEYCQKIKAKQNFFDIITMFELIEHIPGVNNFLKEIMVFLKPNGLVIISTPNGKRLKIKEAWDYPPVHLSRFNCDNLEKLLNQAGLNIQLLKFYNELGYYSNNLIHKMSFSRGLIQSIATNRNNKNFENRIKLKLKILAELKSFICKIIDIPLFLFLLTKKERGHTIIIIAKKI